MKFFTLKFNSEAEKKFIRSQKLTASFDKDTKQLSISGYLVFSGNLESVPKVILYQNDVVEDFKWGASRTPMLKKRFPNALNSDKARLSINSIVEEGPDIRVAFDNNGKVVTLATISSGEKPVSTEILVPEETIKLVAALKEEILAHPNSGKINMVAYR